MKKFESSEVRIQQCYMKVSTKANGSQIDQIRGR